jgi:hypothetical protein
MPVILALRKLRREDQECKCGLGYTVSLKSALATKQYPVSKHTKKLKQSKIHDLIISWP